jgi:hypothetical protein
MNERRVVNAEEIFKVLSTSLVDGYRFVVVQSVRPALEIDLYYGTQPYSFIA